MGQRVAFLIGGAQKAGTTALHRYLCHHPQLFLPAAKELHFFDDETLNWSQLGGRWGWGRDFYRNYHRHFRQASHQQLWGEATPIYMYWWPSIERIWRYNPALKLVLVLRNPITRAYSHWNMERSRHAESLDFQQAIEQEQQRCRIALPLQHRVYSYLDRGYYSSQLRRIWRFFPPQQTLVLKHEQLLNEPAETLTRVCEYLGVGAMAFKGNEQHHARPYEEAMPERARQWLGNHFEPEIRQLEQLVGWNCSDWMGA